MSSEDLEYRIAKLSLDPGDTLVVKVDEEISDERAANLRSHVLRSLGRLDVNVLVVTKGVDLEVMTTTG